MIKAKGELINRNISWIMISFDNDKKAEIGMFNRKTND